jgi:NADPH-dependent glutamate synthase beta subunit-like oxidoreductase
VDVPGFVRAFADSRFGDAYTMLRRANALPEMCAYVCPSDCQCEGECLEKIFCDRPIPIRDIQLVVCRMARLGGYAGVALDAARTGRKVAVVGGGPAGLACAVRLLERGHDVVVHERGRHLGGTPRGVIPVGRYGDARAEVQAVLGPAVEAGRLVVRCGSALGDGVTLDALRGDSDAVFLAAGLGAGASLGCAEGVMDALTFLAKAKAGELAELRGKVAVLGGGNTAMDAGTTAIELGASDVYLVYRRSFQEMPAWPNERNAFITCGGHCLILTQPLGYETDADGRLTGLRVARTELGTPDASGRRRPVVLEGTAHVLKVDLVIEALGQAVDPRLRAALEGLAFTDGGLVKVAGGGSAATAVEGVFAGGDLVNGGTTAVQGIREGMQAAEEIDRYLAGRKER